MQTGAARNRTTNLPSGSSTLHASASANERLKVSHLHLQFQSKSCTFPNVLIATFTFKGNGLHFEFASQFSRFTTSASLYDFVQGVS